MRIFIDGYGVTAQAVARKLLSNHNITRENIVFNTYDSSENSNLIDFLKSEKLRFFIKPYSVLIDFFSEFKPNYFFSIYGRRIIPKEILSQVIDFSVNLHPSLLPDYKGCFSCPWVIINEEKYTGITFHEIVAKIDSGDILFQEKEMIMTSDTAYSLYHRLSQKFVLKFDDFFSKLVAKKIERMPMPVGGDYYARKVPFNGQIDSSWPPKKIDSFIRAMHFPPFVGATLSFKGRTFEISSYQQFSEIIKS